MAGTGAGAGPRGRAGRAVPLEFYPAADKTAASCDFDFNDWIYRSLEIISATHTLTYIDNPEGGTAVLFTKLFSGRGMGRRGTLGPRKEAKDQGPRTSSL